MFIICWIRTLLSLPLQWLGQVAGWTRTGLDVTLLTAAWWVSGDGRVARQALLRIYSTHGRDFAQLQAQAWMRRAPRPEIAAMGGLIALELGQLETAWELFQAGQQIGPDDEGFLELLEWQLTVRGGDVGAIQDLIRRFESRRDLSPLLRRTVLCSLLWDAVTEKRFDEAARRAKHLLSIEEVPEAHMALWAGALNNGDARASQAHLAAANMAPARKLYYQILGNAVVGYREEAGALLAQLRQAEPTFAAHVEQQLARQGVPA